MTTTYQGTGLADFSIPGRIDSQRGGSDPLAGGLQQGSVHQGQVPQAGSAVQGTALDIFILSKTDCRR